MSYHTLPPSSWFPAEVWSFLSLASVDTTGCYLHGSAAPDQTELYLIHGVHRAAAHTKGGKITWPHLKQSETVPRQTHTCWHPVLPNQSSIFSLLLWEIHVFRATEANILTWPSSSFFYLKYNLPFIKCTCLHMCISVLEARSIYAMLLLLTICSLQIWRRQPGFYQRNFVYVKEDIF